LPTPLLYLSAFFEATRPEYYGRLLGVSQKGEWNAWIEYFLNGVERQAEDALSRAARINGLLDGWRSALAGTPSRSVVDLVELLGQNPTGPFPGLPGAWGWRTRPRSGPFNVWRMPASCFRSRMPAATGSSVPERSWRSWKSPPA
jgi:hypothetical protein